MVLSVDVTSWDVRWWENTGRTMKHQETLHHVKQYFFLQNQMTSGSVKAAFFIWSVGILTCLGVYIGGVASFQNDYTMGIPGQQNCLLYATPGQQQPGMFGDMFAGSYYSDACTSAIIQGSIQIVLTFFFIVFTGVQMGKKHGISSGTAYFLAIVSLIMTVFLVVSVSIVHHGFTYTCVLGGSTNCWLLPVMPSGFFLPNHSQVFSAVQASIICGWVAAGLWLAWTCVAWSMVGSLSAPSQTPKQQRASYQRESYQRDLGRKFSEQELPQGGRNHMQFH